MNSLNPNNRLGLNYNKFGKTQGDKERKKKAFKESTKENELDAIERPSRKFPSGPPPDRMLLDSGTTSHITILSEKVHSTSQCNVSIK